MLIIAMMFGGWVGESFEDLAPTHCPGWLGIHEPNRTTPLCALCLERYSYHRSAQGCGPAKISRKKQKPVRKHDEDMWWSTGPKWKIGGGDVLKFRTGSQDKFSCDRARPQNRDNQNHGSSQLQ